MATLALIQGVVNTFVIFLSRAFGTLLDNALAGSRDSERRDPAPSILSLSSCCRLRSSFPPTSSSCGSRGNENSAQTLVARNLRAQVI